MTEQETALLTRALTTYATMRRYQKRFFEGDKGALKQAIYYENQADNDMANVMLTFKIAVVPPKGPSAQGKLI